MLAESVQYIREINISEALKDLLQNEGYCDDDVFIDDNSAPDGGYYVSIYSQLRRIYGSALNLWINGEKVKLPKMLKNIDMLPECYIAWRYSFFAIYNAREEVKRKYLLREEIILTTQWIVQELKERIKRIIRKYEME